MAVAPPGRRLARGAAALSDSAVRVPALGAFGYWMRRYRRTWRGSVVISVVNPLLFLAALGVGLGRLVDAHQSAHLSGVAYADFLAPGLLAASAMQNAFVEATYPVHEATRPRGAYPAAAATPLSPGDILTGHLMFIAFRIAVSALAFVLVLLAFGVTGPATGALLLPCVLLVGMAFAAPLCAWAVGVERPSRLNGAYRFVAMPLYLFSGTFFAVGQLPGWLQWAVTLTPLYHGTELVRGVALGTAPAGPAAAHAGYLAALALAGTVLAHRGYARRLHR
ncbi:ABC transporter permease [Streptomyces zhihengii]|uniref:Transport permease protein n=1 Tax=Streptomyces zhihengii TaxID=1818004 RepID=A0ABS2V3V6_9ACTN|nr:ABC transporter permease [Streptomyces zhihengii]MBM9624167.1 ABC transporter permease [Streptomyces zhihengii]